MSTASPVPRDSISSTPNSSRTQSPAPQPRARANRSALRDYYGLKSTAKPAESSELSPKLLNEGFHGGVKHSELDEEGFDAEAYVRKLVATKHLEEVLRIEGDLIGEIRSLDSEKKALVYDNYSKLITATDTIKRMRENMGPLMPKDGSLSEDVGKIAGMAGELAMKAQGPYVKKDQEKIGSENEESRLRKKREAETVRWVLEAPQRLESLIGQGKRSEAATDWNEIRELLNKWQGVRGVEEIRRRCEKAVAKT
ncbi:uncharacterized protein KY384_005994 [Bacidia gigantensis]|uniref:uncharacterized protein n=1 Tax=Bacidia gigantensis TaxID=2732470 RepID=UPI001D054275|nr:uncharacterized protein KY384_005994 [Bacidia gigantensis]KAG8529358.1 hypothetical protein KY384_005994 [Bacidia gigantensis]